MQQQPRLSYTFLKRLLLSSAVGSLGVFGALLTLALSLVEYLIHPRRQTIFDLYTLTPYELGLPGEAITFPPREGTYQVSGWYIPHPGAAATILLSPGYRGKAQAVLSFALPLWKAGYNVLAFEYYGHGAPVGAPVTLGYREVQDFLGAITYARARVPQARLGVLGSSMGAAVALLAGAQTGEVEAFVLDSPFATHRGVLAYNFRRLVHLPFGLVAPLVDLLLGLRAGYHLHQVEPLRAIGHLAPRPVLLIQGGQDSVVDPRDASLLFQAAGEPKELWVVPEAEHCCAYYVDRPAYLSTVLLFFDRHLKQQHVSPAARSHETC